MFGVDSGDSDAHRAVHPDEQAEGQGRRRPAGTSARRSSQGIYAGNLTFTIDQQAYLQGFDTIMQLYLYNVSGGLMKPTDTDTGLGIVVKSNVQPYLAPNRFEGSSAKQKTLTPPAMIPH